MGRVRCVVVFESGKIVMNGASKVEDLEGVYDVLVVDLEGYRLRDVEGYLEKKEEKKNKKNKNTKKQTK